MKPIQRLRLFSLAVGIASSLTGCDVHSAPPNSTKPKVSTLAQQATQHANSTDVTDVKTTFYDTGKAPKVYEIRKFPYPFQAMLAISSDADSETLRKFNLVHEFINTTQMTPLGKGLGLDFADSLFMYNGNREPGYVDVNNEPMSDELSYFKGVSDQPYATNVLNHYIHVGWIDTLHSYGDFSQVNQNKTLFTRQLAKQAVQALRDNNDDLTVWTDHGNKSNVDNFGSYGKAPFYSYQQGANPWSKYYHTDLTIPYGVKFVWPDLSSDQFGMESVIYPLMLPDGRRVWGFWRYTNTSYNSKGDPQWNWTPYHLDDQLTTAHLQHIEKEHEYSVVSQHLSGTPYWGVLPQNAVSALRLLANHYHDGKILVARISRLLQYNVTQQYVSYDTTYSNGKAYIHIREILDPVLGAHVPNTNEIRGLTFYTTNPARTVIEIGNTPIPTSLVQDNKSDGVHPSIAVKWYPVDTTNYAETEAGVK
ncbi:hypothetical protein [Alicyclobacillus fastidiosus]|uniref:hypothetical protein n=1 Tax=Alicyclobacillus fastidiosus TaxID=392011 RepID=UPI0023E951AF|nr:hypothetical protein [Alicyclobacillus fastidiosus]GMA66130.1 hypothetical protein GCM10025859_65720 [Alicyclobacillus fastidiosus]